MPFKSIYSGWLCLDKPSGISSNLSMVKIKNLVNRLLRFEGVSSESSDCESILTQAELMQKEIDSRQKTKRNKVKVGYIGTLDPFATGVLPIAVGEARKFIHHVVNDKKVYEFTVEFGSATDTLDVDGARVEVTDSFPTSEQISKALPGFIGKIQQVPPDYSAIKIAGRRACDIVRSGKSVELAPRTVFISSINLVDVVFCDSQSDASQKKIKQAKFVVECSSGTYVRSLARDIARNVGSLCYVSELRRTQSGFFSIKNAIPLEKILEISDTAKLVAALSPLESPLDDIPALRLSDLQLTSLQRGVPVQVEWNDAFSSVLLYANCIFKGVGEVSEDGVLKPVRMCAY